MKKVIWSKSNILWTVSIIALVCVLGGFAYFYLNSREKEQSLAPQSDAEIQAVADEEEYDENWRDQYKFATHYEIYGSGCGTNCQRWRVVDSRTGISTELPFVSENGISFSATNTLIVENPIENTRESFFNKALTHHWEWDGTKFTETRTFMENADGKIEDVVSKGNNMDPEWMWEGDCNYMEEIGYTVCR
jgi:hypothetical protein